MKGFKKVGTRQTLLTTGVYLNIRAGPTFGLYRQFTIADAVDLRDM